jgi:hypothetical protein
MLFVNKERGTMNNKGLSIFNNYVPCSCACKYCFFCSRKTADGVDYEHGKQIALAFDKWRKNKSLNDFYLCYTIGHCADYNQLGENIKLNRSFNFIGASFLQINGIGLKTNEELNEYFKKIKEAGIKNIDTTFYGLPDFHDNFCSRKGDFYYLLDVIKMANYFKIDVQLTAPIFETNRNQMDKMFAIIDKYIINNNKPVIFLQDYRGNGENLEETRLTRESFSGLPEKIKRAINISRYKTEAEWIKTNEWTAQKNRTFVLALKQDTLRYIDGKSCDEIMDYLIDLDEKYYAALPGINDLSKIYGDVSNNRLYRERDLRWKWGKKYIRDNRIIIHDVTDERSCGSLRF